MIKTPRYIPAARKLFLQDIRALILGFINGTINLMTIIIRIRKIISGSSI
jgi:hypothetical protein